MPSLDRRNELLQEIKERITDEKDWTQGRMALDSQDMPVHSLSDGAVRFCLVGSVKATLNRDTLSFEEWLEYTDLIENTVHCAIMQFQTLRGINSNDLDYSMSMSDFNDSQGRRHSEVLEVLGLAIDSPILSDYDPLPFMEG